MGAPSTFSEATADIICRRLAAGESLRTICRDSDMPDRTTVQRWIDTYDTFRIRYAHARNIGLDTLAEEILDIADRPSGTLESGATDSGDVQHRKLQVDARRWLLSKMAPKKYGDKLEQTLQGPDGGSIKIDDASAADKLAKLMASARARKASTTGEQDEVDTSDLI